MKKHHRLLSLLLSAALCFGMALPMLADDTAAAELPVTATSPVVVTAEDPLSVIPEEEYSKIVFDNDEKYNLMAMSSLSPVVEYTTYKDVACSQVKYSNAVDDAGRDSFRWLSSSGERVQYALTPYMKTANAVNTDHKYLVVTYAAKTEGAHTLYYHSFTGGVYTLDKDLSRSNGDWVTTAPVEITTDVYARINQPNYFVLWANIDEEDAELYIREMVFFQDKEDAELYAKDAPLFYDPITEEEIQAEEIAKQNRKRILLMMLLLGVESVKNTPPKVEVPTVEVPDPFAGMEDYYTKITFATDPNNFEIQELYTIGSGDFDPDNHAVQTEHNNVPAYKIIKADSPCTWLFSSVTTDANKDGIVDNNTYSTNMWTYRHFPITMGVLYSEQKYMAITYASTSSPNDAGNDMYIWAAEQDENKKSGFLVAEDIGTNGAWKTIVFAIPDNLRTRIAKSMKFAILSSDTSDYEELYIAECGFFNSLADANKYATQAEEIYNALAPEDYECPIDPYDYVSQGAFAEIVYTSDSTKGGATALGNNNESLDPDYPVVTYRGVQVRQINPHEGGTAPRWVTGTTTVRTFYNYPFCSEKAGQITPDFGWMILIYAAEPVAADTIYVNDSVGGVIKLQNFVTNGVWTATAPYQVPAGMFDRMNGTNSVPRGKLTLALEDRPEDPHSVEAFYIERMMFFKDEDEAAAFAAAYTARLASLDENTEMLGLDDGDYPFASIDNADFSAIRFIYDIPGVEAENRENGARYYLSDGNTRDRLRFFFKLKDIEPSPVKTTYGNVDCVQVPYATDVAAWNMLNYYAPDLSGNEKDPSDESYVDYKAYDKSLKPRYTLTFTTTDNVYDITPDHQYFAITYASSSSPR